MAVKNSIFRCPKVKILICIILLNAVGVMSYIAFMMQIGFHSFAHGRRACTISPPERMFHALTVPPCAWIIFSQIVRPRPETFLPRSVVKNG